MFEKIMSIFHGKGKPIKGRLAVLFMSSFLFILLAILVEIVFFLKVI